MKTPSTDLFELIKSLNAQEKKYLKQYAQQYSDGRENTYMLLFNAIAEQTAYDEDAIKQKFKKHAFAKQLSVAKNYLFEKILDALISMHTDTDENLQIEKMISRFGLLFRRNQIPAALAFYGKAEKRALEKGNLTLLPHITRQKNLLLVRSASKFSHQDWIQNAEGALQHARVLENFLHYEMLSSKAGIIFADGRLNKNEQLKKELDDIMGHALFKDETCALSFKAWHYYSKTKYRYLFTLGKTDECFEFITRSITYLEKNRVETDEWKIAYFRTLTDTLTVGVNARKYDDCERILTSLELIMDQGFPLLPIIRQAHFQVKLEYHAASGRQLKQALAFWQSNQDYWNTIKQKIEIPAHNQVLFEVIRLYFLAADFKNALLVFNELIQHKTLNVFEGRARIYYLMIQYEIENLEVLPGIARNVNDWFTKNKVASEQEKCMVNFFNNISKARDKYEVRQKFEALKKKIEALDKEELSSGLNAFPDLERWIQSKIENKTMLQVMLNN